jgi:hypothetical protein
MDQGLSGDVRVNTGFIRIETVIVRVAKLLGLPSPFGSEGRGGDIKKGGPP